MEFVKVTLEAPSISIEFSSYLVHTDNGYLVPKNISSILIESVWWGEEYLGRIILPEVVGEKSFIEWFCRTDGKRRKYGIYETDLLSVPLRTSQVINLYSAENDPYELIVSGISSVKESNVA